MIKQQGYILMLSMTLIAVMAVMVTSVVNRAIVGRSTTRTARDRDQARALALSGLEIAYAQLALPTKSENEKKEQKDISPELWTKYSSWWQEFSLTEEHDGVEGSIKIYIAPEFGKINLNNLYDFKQKKFVVDAQFDARKILKGISDRLRTTLKGANFTDILEKLFRDFGPLDDITQLKNSKELEKLAEHFFAEDTDHGENFKPALADLFTVQGTHKEINAAALSRSVQWLLGLPILDDDLVKKARADIAPKIKESFAFPSSWDTLLQPLYKKNYTEIGADYKGLFNTKFEGKLFSVVSYGKIGNITQRIYALIERTLSRDQRVNYIIRKIYWL